jgi:gliding motility-associated-like protein
MRKIYLLSTLLLLTIVYGSKSYAQDFSNKGKDFWISYPEHVDGNLSAMGIYITSDRNAIGTITVGATTINFSLLANQVVRKFIGPNASGDASNVGIQLGGIQDGVSAGGGIHVVSSTPVVVFAHIIRSARSGATLVLPTNVWGKEYIVPSYRNTGTTASFGEINVIASKPNTVVEITPSVTTRNGAHAAGVPFTVTIPAVGSVYQLQFQQSADISGTIVKSIASTAGTCNPIAVYSATTWSGFPCNNASGGDNLFQQLFPTGTWGKQFLTAPLKKVATNIADNNVDIIKVYVKDPTTVVTKTEAGVTTTLTGLTSANYYEFTTFRPTFIQADKNIQVVQFVTSETCGTAATPVTNSDPEMVVLSSVEQTINDITVFSATQATVPPGQSQVTTHYLNIIMKTNNTGSFTINGVAPTTAFIPIPATNYSYLKQPLNTLIAANPTNPVFNLKADSAFSAIAYGFGNVESYGYNAGTNVKDPLQQIGVSTEFGIETTPSVCASSPFKFKISLPYQPLELDWNLTSLPPGTYGHIIQPGSPTVPFDSTTTVNGKQIWWYSLPSFYSIGTVGTYPVSITVENSGIDNCGNSQEILFDLEVSAPPLADFTWDPNECVAVPVQFKDASTTTKPTYKYSWDFGDPLSGAANTSTLKNPTHTFSGPGIYTVSYSNITTPGCISNTRTQQITIAPLPSATITGDASVCINSAPVPVTITITGGKSPYRISYTVDDGSTVTPFTIDTPGPAFVITQPTTIAGTFIYKVVNIRNVNSAACTQALNVPPVTVTVTANTTLALTSATATSSQAVCVNTPIVNITYAIGGGGNNATVSGLPNGVNGAYVAGVFTISGTPTNTGTTPQTFTYTVTATGACNPITATGTITVNPDATITLTSAAATTLQEVCKNIAITNITYTIAGGGNGGSVNIVIPGVTFTFGPAGSVIVSGSPTTAGTYNYTINTTGTCAQTSASGTIIVNELPSADFTISAPNCENKTVTLTDASIPNTGSLNNWQWTFGDATTGSGTPATHTYALAGTYNVSLTVTTNKGCVSSPAASKPVTISVNPKAGFMVPEVCINDIAAVFIDTSRITPGTINAWKWDFGDASPVTTTKDGTHLYSTTGLYTVTHIVYSTTGCSDTIKHDIFINGATPAADFSVMNPTTLCSNDSVSIINLSVVNPGNVTKVEIYWDNTGAPTVFDTDDVPVLNKVYKHKYPTLQTTRTYRIRFRAYSGTLCVNDKFINVVVNAAPKVQFNNMPNVCLNAVPFQITQASETGGVVGTPLFTGPGVSPTGLFSPAVAGAGTHSIKYTFTATAGGCIDTLTKTIHVYAQPDAAFSYTNPVCETKDVLFTDNTVPTEGTLTTWTWDFGDGSPLLIRNSNNSFTHKFPAAGTFTVKLVVTTSNGCLSKAKTISVTVNPQPKVNFLIPASVCLPNANVTFTDRSSIADGTETGFIYSWNFGDPGSATNTDGNKNPSHVYTAVGPFNVNLQVTSAAGCVHDTTIVLNTIHPQPIADIVVDKIDVCIGSSFVFTDNSNPLDGTITQRNWTMDDGNVRNTPTFTYTYTAEGTYNVGLFIFNSNGCRSNTAIKTVNVNPYPVANAGPDKFVLEGGQVELTPALPIGISVTYLWSPPTGLNNPTLPNAISKPTDDITYKLTVTSDKGCEAPPDFVFIKVLKAPAIPNIFSPNGDGVHDLWGIEYLNTYPGATIDVYNRYGQLVFHSVGYTTQWDGKSNGKDVPVGTYYYVIDPKNGRQKMAGYVDVIR